MNLVKILTYNYSDQDNVGEGIDTQINETEQNKTEEIAPHTYGQLILTKVQINSMEEG